MSKHPNATTKKKRKPGSPRYASTTIITLDGEAARLDMPRDGKATVSAINSTRRLKIDREEAQAVLREHKGAFVSPKFARPREVA
jgi:hypothetical protein